MATYAGRSSARPPADAPQSASQPTPVPRTRAEARALAEAQARAESAARSGGRTRSESRARGDRRGRMEVTSRAESRERLDSRERLQPRRRSEAGLSAQPVDARRAAPQPLRHTEPLHTARHVVPPQTPRHGDPQSFRRSTTPPVPSAPRRVVPPDAETVTLTRRELRAREREQEQRREAKRSLAKPILAGGLTVGLVASIGVYATGFGLGEAEAAFVVGTGVSAQTDELAKARTVDTTYRAAASVSRNERRTAITVAGARDAAELEAKAKAEAARKAREAEEARRRAELARQREQAIANARQNPQAAARVLMVDHGWTSDAQYNCLVNLWNGESNWNYRAENSSSGAYGIPQSLPGSKMAKFGDDWRTNPITQIKWGLWYIDQVYGSPCNAWSTWQSRSPHWY